MGDVLMSWNRRSWPQALASGLALALVLGGCAAGGGARADADLAPTAAPVSVAPAAAAEPPVRVTSVTLREGAPGTRLDLEVDGPVVWTQYRDPEGRLVVELPNAVTTPSVVDLTAATGLVSAVAISDVAGDGRPLVRLAIETRAGAEHDLVLDGSTLRVNFEPSGSAGAVVATEPLEVPAEPVETVAETPAPAAPAEAIASGVIARGTADQPVSGGAAAPTATALSGVELEPTAGGALVRIWGDGSFAWSTFRLSNPERLVIDLSGVTNSSPASAVAGSGSPVERVRVAQFRPEPDAVSRVVVDLAYATEARIIETPNGLEVAVGDAQALASTQTTYSEPVPVTVDEPELQIAASEPSPQVAEPLPADPPAPLLEEQPVTVATLPAPGEPASEPLAVAPPPRSVALFEALDVPQDDGAGAGSSSAGGAPNYAALEVGAQDLKYTGEPINFSLRDADIKEVLRTFAKLSGLNVIVQPGVSGSVTVEFQQVPWDQALEQILKINDLWYEVEGNIMRIAPRAKLNAEAEAEAARRRAVELSVPLRTIVKRVSYANASQVSSLLARGGRAGILSERGSVTVDQRTNTLIIKELPSFMDSVLAIIEELDEAEPQVLIEARIVETTKRLSRSLGIAWGFDGEASSRLGNTTGLDFPNRIESDGGVNLLTGGANGFLNLSLGNVLDSFVLDAQLQAAESEGLINILSTPKITTLNNERAEIQSGLQIPIQTVSNNTVTVQFVNATLRLAVTPQVTAEGTVLMDIDIQKREPQLAFAVVGATNAPIATKEARTRVIVRDGGTTVIGGIYEVSADQGQDRVPGLANIPFIGRLFQNNRRTDENEELLIFITPRVMKL